MMFSYIIAAIVSLVHAQDAYQLGVVAGTIPAICPQIVQFNTCAMKAGTDAANCNSLVTDVPNFAYYQCLCTAQKSSLSCYDICPSDQALQQQKAANSDSATNTCSYVAQQQAAGMNPTDIASTTQIAVGTNKIIAPVVKTRSLPPVAQSTNVATSSGPTFLDDSSAPAENMFVASCVVAVGAAIALML